MSSQELPSNVSLFTRIRCAVPLCASYVPLSSDQKKQLETTEVAHLTSEEWVESIWTESSATVKINPPKLSFLTRAHLRAGSKKTAAFFYLVRPEPVSFLHGTYEAAFIVTGADLLIRAKDIRVRPDGAIAVVGGYDGPATRHSKLPSDFPTQPAAVRFSDSAS